MRIGIDARPLVKQRAGIGTYVYNIVKKLNSIDKNNEYYLFSCREIYLDFELGSNWHIVEVPFKVGTIWLSLLGGRLIRKYDIDVFWGTQHVLPLFKRSGTEYVLTICDLAQFRIRDIGSRYNTVVQKVFVKGSCKRADRIIAISEATKYDIVHIFGIEASKISCIYLGGIDRVEPSSDDEIAEVKKHFGINGRYFLYISTIEPRKNVETIIEGFDRLMDNSEEKVYLVLAGGLGWKYENVLKKIEQSKYGDCIIRTGFVSQKEKQSLLTGAAAFVYPSLYEGFGIPLLEAMNYNLPIITANVSSLPEVGQDAVFYLENPKSADDMSRLMRHCLGLSEEEKDRIAANDEKQRSRFSWERCAAETLKVLTK